LGDVSTSTAPSLRCPRCSATLRAGSEWCSLCFADLRPREPEPVLVGPPPASVDAADAEAVPVLDEPEAPRAPVVARAGGKHAKHAKQPVFGAASTTDQAEVERLADRMLVELAAAESGNPIGAASTLVDSTPKRALLMVGGSIAAMALLFIVMAVAGALL
jgi:hypothetical protein